MNGHWASMTTFEIIEFLSLIIDQFNKIIHCLSINFKRFMNSFPLSKLRNKKAFARFKNPQKFAVYLQFAQLHSLSVSLQRNVKNSECKCHKVISNAYKMFFDCIESSVSRTVTAANTTKKCKQSIYAEQEFM